MVNDADYCRQLGFVVGDTIEGSTHYSTVRLKIKYIGSNVVVFDEFRRVKDGDFWVWQFEKETAHWTLCGRKWERVSVEK